MAIWTPIGNAFVFSGHAEGAPLPVGQIALQAKGFAFKYANSWLARPESFSIDPLNLPLTEQQSSSSKLWGAFEDSTPDNWGKKVLLATHKQHPQNEIEWLLASRGAGVGCLLFSASRHQLPALHESPPFESLERLLLAADHIDQGDYQPSEEMAKLLEFGSSMGGARPKVTVHYREGEWIAKLGRRDDIFDQARAEFASLNMAEAAGIKVPEHELIEVAGRAVLLVKRFDRQQGGRSHYLSAYASINPHRMRVGDNDGPMSYLRIADVLKKTSADAFADLLDLYTRMAFNVLIGNTDDHLRNHGCLMTGANTYRLSPAFDVLPHPTEQGLQALIIGEQGRLSSLDNLLSAPERFGIQRDQARQIIIDLCQVTVHADQYFKDAGMSAQDTSILSKVCRRFNPVVESW
ncbi:type II toxin-antitoxin system HipA family toxin [Pseudomonas sp. CCI3.2]|uniref:type II toxin-antitoxin system HipA family toxin n=1 Tax=unclassified Pseudomonas TaxID=196821 RepID=UPI002AC90FF9|nr:MULTISPECIES: type II toxin-antitoxin system HipA family toxin [unclassified Pseudomonas]MEB0079479.1 type II toxin-antitoxin system HipA family toxin [Pseudomonas sp. MH10out]MEB0102496.1 type II toxin-antitoxin system HipA family toxin [Pseudomonas sp. CCI3.2]MEB0132450.1 type II toxin-antitoxin system HipA family toxin [Pseudomonas sp. CCI2.4]MEB0159222.1 type II toxin-antitoxin system HipA family toxin [Pseudomonas sp. AH2 (2023)]MEB0169165.1 type II toxin-antitoxin system HipA family t